MTDGKIDKPCVMAIFEYIETKSTFDDIHHRCHVHKEINQCDILHGFAREVIKAENKVREECLGD